MHSDGYPNPQRMKDHVFQIKIQYNVVCINMHAMLISLLGAYKCMGGTVGSKE